MIKDKESYQCKRYKELYSIDVIPVKYKDYKENFRVAEKIK